MIQIFMIAVVLFVIGVFWKKARPWLAGVVVLMVAWQILGGITLAYQMSQPTQDVIATFRSGPLPATPVPPEQAPAIAPISKPLPTTRPLPTPRQGEYELPDRSRAEMDEYFTQVQELVDDARRVCGKMDKDGSMTLSGQEIFDWHGCVKTGLEIATKLTMPRGCDECGDLNFAVWMVLEDIRLCKSSKGQGKWGMDVTQCNKVMSGLQRIDSVIFQYWR